LFSQLGTKVHKKQKQSEMLETKILCIPEKKKISKQQVTFPKHLIPMVEIYP
jgi:hypothetical protein